VIALVLAELAVLPVLPLGAQETVGEPLGEEREQQAGIVRAPEGGAAEQLVHLLDIGVERRLIPGGTAEMPAGIAPVG
jgi:hypothetical protein